MENDVRKPSEQREAKIMSRFMEIFLRDVEETQKEVEVMTANSQFYSGKITTHDNEVIILNSEMLSMVYAILRSHIVAISLSCALDSSKHQLIEAEMSTTHTKRQEDENINGNAHI